MRFPAGLSRAPFETAIQKLRDGRPGESGYGHRVAILLTIPAFDDPVARDVRRAASGELYVVRTVWQRSLDAPSRRQLAGVDPSLWLLRDSIAERRPSLWSTTVHVDQGVLTALLDAVRSATLPCHPNRASSGTPDAATYELSFSADVNETRYRWRGDPPSGWQPLATFATRLAQLVDDPVGATR